MLARAVSRICFAGGIICAALFAAREIFGVAIGFPPDAISLQFANVPLTVVLALALFTVGATIGRRSPQLPNAHQSALGAGRAEQLQQTEKLRVENHKGQKIGKAN